MADNLGEPIACPQCGKKQWPVDDLVLFACEHCGSVYLIYSSDFAIDLQPVTEMNYRARVTIGISARQMLFAMMDLKTAEDKLQNQIDKLLPFSILVIVFFIIAILVAISSPNNRPPANNYTIPYILISSFILLVAAGWQHHKLGPKIEAIQDLITIGKDSKVWDVNRNGKRFRRLGITPRRRRKVVRQQLKRPAPRIG